MKLSLFLLALLLPISSKAQPIMPLQQGLTLAHIIVDGEDHTIAVMQDHQHRIRGFDLSAATQLKLPPVPFYQQLGHTQIKALIEQADARQFISIDYAELQSPAGKGAHHIALGLNYAAHADEVQQQAEPFMFIKTVLPSREQAIPFAAHRLLDYEVEICARPLQDITHPQQRFTKFGFFVCGDFSDRAYLMRHINLENMQSGQGFSRAKSLPGYFPTGPYLVIPENQANFLNHIELSLTHNASLKQHSSSAHLIWRMPELLAQLFKRQRSQQNTYSPASTWLPEQMLSTDISILTGTPEGVLMQAPSTWYRIKTGTWYFLSGQFLEPNLSVQRYIVERFIQQQFAERRFLQPGDTLELSAQWMGSIRLSIAATEAGLSKHTK